LPAQLITIHPLDDLEHSPNEADVKGIDAFTWFMGVSRARQMLAVIERTDLKAADLKTM